MTPAAAKSDNSVICFPALSRVSAPQILRRGGGGDEGDKYISLIFSLCLSNCVTTAGLSMGGDVSGKIVMRVKPPAAAACNRDESVSRSSKPGSPEWLYKSTKPGPKTKSRQSLICVSCGTSEMLLATDLIMLSVINTSAIWSVSKTGSITRTCCNS